MVKVRFLVFLFVSFRSREAPLCLGRNTMSSKCLFGYVSMKREQQKTPNDARRVEGRRDGKSRPRGDAKKASVFFDDIFSRAKKQGNDETRARARKRRAAFGSGFPAFRDRSFRELTFFFISLSLSLSLSSSRSSKTHRLGKPKSRSRRRRKSRNTRATSSACGPSSPAYSARCCPSRCTAGINTGPYRKNLSANLNTAIRRI